MSEHADSANAQPDSLCVLCCADEARLAWSGTFVLAMWDAFPVSSGHAIIVPRRHAASWNDLTADEKNEIITGIDAVRALIDERRRPEGYNVGFNDGVAAGQTVMHFHVHVIPRYDGDVSDPRGGVRWVLGDKAAYWQNESK